MVFCWYYVEWLVCGYVCGCSVYVTEGTTAAHISKMHSIMNETQALAAHVEQVRGTRPLILPYAWEFCTFKSSPVTTATRTNTDWW